MKTRKKKISKDVKELLERQGKVTYGVITEIPDEYESGNKYDHVLESRDIRFDMLPKYQNMPDSLIVRLQNFELGEILILNDYGREIAGKGRKPGKWYVTCEEFSTIQEAIVRALEVVVAQRKEYEKK